MNLLSNTKNLKKMIMVGKLTVAVYGLGYVGSAIAAVWLRVGAKVIGVDKLDSVVAKASKGTLSLEEKAVNEALRRGIREKRFQATTDGMEASKLSEFKIVSVPVLIQRAGADVSNVMDVAATIAHGIKKGDVVSISPTIPPGTTDSKVLPTVEKISGLKGEIDFGLVYSPERIYVGRSVIDMEENYPTIVSGIGPRSLNAGAALYSLISKKGVIKMNSIRAAEMEKIFEGVYRDVNIALANELAKVCETLGIDFWESRNAANSQQFCRLHKPGTGVGGACIPVYPRFLMDLASRVKADYSITALARKVNSLMPKYCAEKALALLYKKGKQPSDSKVAVLGLAFRGGVSDTRLSPSYDVINQLIKVGCKVVVHDPYVSEDKKIPPEVILTQNLNQALARADLVIIVTDHKQYSRVSKKTIEKYATNPLVVYDGRGVLDESKFRGVFFDGVGRGRKFNPQLDDNDDR